MLIKHTEMYYVIKQPTNNEHKQSDDIPSLLTFLKQL